MNVKNSEFCVDDLGDILYKRSLTYTSLTHQYDRLARSDPQIDKHQLHEVIQREHNVFQVFLFPKSLLLGFIHTYLQNFLHEVISCYLIIPFELALLFLPFVGPLLISLDRFRHLVNVPEYGSDCAAVVKHYEWVVVNVPLDVFESIGLIFLY